MTSPNEYFPAIATPYILQGLRKFTSNFKNIILKAENNAVSANLEFLLPVIFCDNEYLSSTGGTIVKDRDFYFKVFLSK